MKKFVIPILIIVMVFFEVSPMKEHLIDQLKEHDLLDLYSELYFLSFTIFFSIILVPIQNVLYDIIDKMNFVNNVFIKNGYKMSEEVIEIISKVKVPTKKKIVFILLVNVIVYGLFISIIAEFKLNIPNSMFLPVKIIFLISLYLFIYRFFLRRINHSIYNILLSSFFSIVFFLYTKKEIIIFIIIQNIILYTFRMFVKRKSQ